jgi:putative transposase
LPWKETCTMKEKMKLVTLYETGMFTVTKLAKRCEISRKTAYKWLYRYDEEGIAGLDERSRAPKHSPTTTPEEVVLAVIKAKQAHPTLGDTSQTSS